VSRLLNHTVRDTRRLLTGDNPPSPEKAALDVVRGLKPHEKYELRRELEDQIAKIDERYVDNPHFQNIGIAMAIASRFASVVDITDNARARNGDATIVANTSERMVPDFIDRRLRQPSS
jgi:hypothetical protein